MKRKTYTLYLSCEEYGVILDALIRFKNKLTRQGRYTDIVDEVILALLAASDTTADQTDKLAVRDAILALLDAKTKRVYI